MPGDDGGSTVTYSIVARDAVTGDLGVAVQTCMFAVGSTVPWARPGIGAVATQAITEAAYGPRCLDQLAHGTYTHRLLATLDAGEAAGGDARGRMSAALLVVSGDAPSQPGAGTLVDLRVDRSEDPLGDLSKLLVAAEVFAGFSDAVDLLFGGDPVDALAKVDDALVLLPRDENMRFLRSGALVASGELDAGIAELRSLIAKRPTWEVVVGSFVAKGLFPVPVGVSIEAVFG
jgi:uncharacterized Ntn-hydrolase superfamily protein